jgi:hypothetical protein
MRMAASLYLPFWLSSFADVTRAQTQPTPLPENTIPCDAFKRSPDGVWRVEETVTFDVGSTKAMTLRPTSIPRGAIVVADGQDLAEILDQKCGGRAYTESRVGLM